MQQCGKVDKGRETVKKRKAQGFAALYDRNSELRDDESEFQADAPELPAEENENNRGLLSGNPFSLFSGVFPGTKWCGTGDIAKNFHDLGTVSLSCVLEIDRKLIRLCFTGEGHGSMLPGPRHLPSENPRVSVAL